MMALPASSPAQKRIVLIGGGHAHVEVLRAFGMQPEPGVELVLIAKELDAPYSGMLPGFVAGHYTFDDCHIDLVRLARFAGARLIHGEANGIDRRNRRVMLKDRPPVAYDLLSIDTGITPLLDDIQGASQWGLAVKPVSSFGPRWQATEARALQANGPRRFVVVGTGAAGFELVLAIRQRLQSQAGERGIAPDAFSFTLVGKGELLTSHNTRAQAYARRALAEAGVALITGEAAVSVTADTVGLASGRIIASDVTVITTKAAPPEWFASTDLMRDPNGFLGIRPTLQLLDDNDVFAVGDCASTLDHPREKAGVFAVRQGPPLTRNLRRRLANLAAQPFVPQKRFLTLLSTGGRAAIAARGPLAAAGGWVWTWKDHIDRTFMARFNTLPIMAPAAPLGTEDLAMRCRGCAAKIDPVALRGALGRLNPLPASHAIRDLAPGDDAALLDLGLDALRLETVDFFPAFWPDPYLFGQIAAAHAMSDIYAKGGTPDHALAIAVLPHKPRNLREDDLFQLMAGARSVLDRDGVALVGGHSSEGVELAAGFFVSGHVPRHRGLSKGGARPGDQLILTKPLGTGILFAAWMRGQARASQISAALAGMCRTNRDATQVLLAHGATAATDVTGFGLGGHLLEMLDATSLAASPVSATIVFERCPLYAGVEHLAKIGIRSTLIAETASLAERIGSAPEHRTWTLPIVLDPQTSGGLLAALPADRAAAALADLRAAGLDAALVGEVRAADGDGPSITLTA